MLTIHFTSGLGNQLFQYFFGESLRLNHNYTNVNYIESTLAPYQINIWDIFDTNINWKESNIKNKFLLINLFKLLIKFKFEKKFNIVSDNSIVLHKNYYSYNSFNFYGYWQNISYFEKEFSNIRKNLIYKKKIILQNLIKKYDQYSDVVGIHIRGGDYLLKKNQKLFSNINREYYSKSINFLKNKLDNPLFLIFSDDENYSKKLINFIGGSFIFAKDINDNRNDDFQLLSKCDHFIIPNSTFSWWAASLSNSLKKIVIMPKEWFKEDIANFNVDITSLNQNIDLHNI